MKIGLVISLLLTIRFANPADDGKRLKVGDVVYVHAPTGLTLRKIGAKDGAKVALLPYDAAPLTVLALPDPTIRYVGESMGSFAVSGGWVKVKTRAGQEGYLFDGYLSRYPPAIEEPEEGIERLDWFYRTISPLKGKRTTLPPIDGTIERYRQSYADGATFELQAYPGGVTQLLELPKDKFTMQEVLVLFRPVWFSKEKTTGKYDATKQRLEVVSESGYLQFDLQPKGNRLLLRFAAAD